jgi:hypothetical protein
MIYTRIQGGLGNQLFQYCTGRVLADKLGVELGLDIRGYDENSPFGVGLGHFNLRANDTPLGLPSRKEDGLGGFIWDRICGRHKNIYKAAHLGYDPQVFRLSDGAYIKGYWQSETYFIDQRAQILKDLEIVTPPSAENIAALQNIENCLSVSLHIRRGDYVSNAKYNAMHGTCDLNYYERAVAYLVEKLGNDIVIFAFSDDPDWVAENLKLPVEVHYMRHNSSEKNYEDLRLMARCKHHIVANSSFSWWGAWLNPSNDKMVLAPKRWYEDANTSNPDIVPPAWIEL